MELQYFFVKPRYPIIGIINGNLVAARSKSTFEKKIAKFELKEKSYQIIDVTGRYWSLHTDNFILFPEIVIKPWTKKALIDLYNNSDNITTFYSVKSIQNKRLERIFNDIVDLIMKKKKQSF